MAKRMVNNHFLYRFIDRPTLAEQAKADRRVVEYLAALPNIGEDKAKLSAVAVCQLERESRGLHMKTFGGQQGGGGQNLWRFQCVERAGGHA